LEPTERKIESHQKVVCYWSVKLADSPAAIPVSAAAEAAEDTVQHEEH
jgi:hypothetical protein